MVDLRAPLRRLLPLAAFLPALTLSAAQMLPSLELNGLGLRTGGLPYRLAASFSLRPRLLVQTFLPPFGARLAEAFASEGYAEFVCYLGITGLALAVLGALSLRGPRNFDNRNRPQDPAAHAALALLAVCGLLLALGAYNPLYYLLWRFIPGFNLFRVPARWLALYALGAAGLAGVGFEAWSNRWPVLPWTRLRQRWPVRARWLIPALVVLGGMAASQQWPGRLTLLGWALSGVVLGALLWAGRRRPVAAQGALLALVVAELWLGSRALPYVLATAPAATSLRNAPAALLAATADQPPAGRDRYLSMSDIRFDPGDLAELRGLQADRLSSESVERFVRAAKQMEVVAPNLSLLLGLPGVDGYDGGILPLASYVKLQSLFLPAGQVSPDGRLREQLSEVPDGRLLDLTATRFVITDKQNDLWAGDVYYDLEQAAPLQPGSGAASRPGQLSALCGDRSRGCLLSHGSSPGWHGGGGNHAGRCGRTLNPAGDAGRQRDSLGAWRRRTGQCGPRLAR